MKILAIRGRNIASLAGPFEVDLEGEPLGRAGLFAIIGPTGAGKTTLLDCICLALFDKVPRLAGGRGARVSESGEETGNALFSGDVRNLLRRGHAAGFAEVDFLGIDGGRYRACWRVRRARGRINGKLQPQSMALTNLDSGADLSDTRKTETLSKIQERLGLDFEQFCRSVLLAQGEFAAFLKADSGQRSELLERMTGTAIYSSLSKAAHRAYREATTRLEHLRQGLETLAPLPPEALAGLREKEEESEMVVCALTWRIEQIQLDLRWNATLQKLKTSETEAEQALANQEEIWRDLGEKRELLEEVEAAQKLAAPLAECEGLREEVGQGGEKLKECESRDREAEARLKQGEALLAEAAAAENSSRNQWDAAHPLLAKAAVLDGAIEEKSAQRDAAQVEWEQARKEAEQTKRRHESLERRFREIEDRSREIDDWKEGHAHDGALAQDWRAWEAELVRFLELIERRSGLSLELEVERKQLKNNADRAEQHKALQEAALNGKELAQKKLSEARERHQFLQKGDWKTREERLEAGGRVLHEAQKLAQELEHLNARQSAAMAAWTRCGLEISAATEEKGRVEARQKENAIRLSEAEHARRLAESRASFRERRHELLVEGEPCPLCGATSHPYRGDTNSENEMVTQQKLRVRELREARDLLLKAGSMVAEHLKAQSARAVELDEEMAGLDQSSNELHGRWKASREEAERVSLHLPRSPLVARLEEMIEKLQEERESAKEARDARERAREEYGAAQELLSETSERLAELERGFNRIELSLTQGRARLQGLEKQWRQTETDRETFRRGLVQIYQDRGFESLEAEPAAFLAETKERVRVWGEKAKLRDQLGQELSDVERDLALVLAQAEEREKGLAPRKTAFEQAEIRLAEIVEERASYFEGQPVGEVEARLKNDLKEKVAGLERARQNRDRADRERTGLVREIAGLREALQRCEERWAESERALKRLLAEKRWDETILGQRLEFGEDWIQNSEDELKRAETDRAHARSVLEERRARTREHLEGRRPEQSEEELAQSLVEARAALEAVEQRLNETRLALRMDQEKRREAEARLPEVEAQQKKTDLWEVMHGLIGSHDGKKFRELAQSLTLDALIQRANFHMRDLEPRYHLQRVPHHDLEIQVIDRHMGDEVRSPRSLSGGESFLVSLALALGLSTLSSQRTSIDSLFIDEGFGTLDAQTLDAALATLDMLQASGRQIGIISHIREIAERVGARVQVVRTSRDSSRVEIRGI